MILGTSIDTGGGLVQRTDELYLSIYSTMEQTKKRILEEAGQFINISLGYDEKYTGKNPWVPTIHLRDCSFNTGTEK